MRNTYEPACECRYMAPVPLLPEEPKFANAYVPFQQGTGKVYSPDKGLNRGTVFADLDQPYGYKKDCSCMADRY